MTGRKLAGLAAGIATMGLVNGGAFAAQHPTPPSTDHLVCSPATNGGTLMNGVCVLPAATVGQQYQGFIITSNNSGGAFEVSAGSIPPGTELPAEFGASGTIVGGTPTQTGTFTFTVTGVDQEGVSLQQTYSVTVDPALPLTVTFPTSGFAAGTVGQLYLQNIFTSGGVAPTTAALTSGQLPPGLTLSSAAPISVSGTPTVTGTFKFTITITDSVGDQVNEPGSITIS